MHKEKFEEGDRGKMPLILFGDGLNNKSHVKYKGLRTGVSNVVYKQLKVRERIGQLLLMDINEFRTSKVSIHVRRTLKDCVLNDVSIP